VDAGLGIHLPVARELGISTVQLHAPHPASRTSARAQEFLKTLEEFGITLTAVFGGFDGESYADIPTVEQTVGLVPSATRAERVAEMKSIAEFARELNCDVVALHLGFVPHDRESSGYREIVDVTQQLCDFVAKLGQALHLETGQETAPALVQFIDDVQRGNLFVNFDPANMILYGTGEPIEALEMLGQRVRSVHCKDARWAARPGQEWGQEVPLGAGQVNMRRYLETLKKIGYDGPLTIEREIPQEPTRQKSEIAGAVELLQQLRAEIWA
jgi:sugar phosphate isomerase/epimerase